MRIALAGREVALAQAPHPRSPQSWHWRRRFSSARGSAILRAPHESRPPLLCAPYEAMASVDELLPARSRAVLTRRSSFARNRALTIGSAPNRAERKRRGSEARFCLLSKALLREPGGFEGLGAIGIDDHCRDLST
jgi:hypothetical protein